MNFELRPDAGAAPTASPAQAPRAGRQRLLPGALLLAVALALAVPSVQVFTLGPAAAQALFHAKQEIVDSRDRVLSDARYQTDRPQPLEQPKPSSFQLPAWLGKLILWAAIVVVVAAVLYFVGSLIYDLLRDRTAFRRSRGRPADAPAKVETPLASRREAEHHTLAEADRLAAEGRFSEAIHLLLLVALERLRRELGPRVAPAMTSRELLRLMPIPGEVIDPLTRMVQVSEVNHFGGRSASAPDYRACRDDFLRFNGMESQPA